MKICIQHLLTHITILLSGVFSVLFTTIQNDIGAFLVPHEAELQTKEHVVIYDSNTSSLKDKSEFFDLIVFHFTCKAFCQQLF